MDGTDEQFLAIPEESLRLLPDDISDEAGVLIGDALGTPYHAVKKAEVHPGDYVGVWGAGPLGIMAALTAKIRGARVIAVDYNDYRLDMAAKYGADFLINPEKSSLDKEIQRITKGAGLNSTIQCTPSGNAVIACLRNLGLRGIMVQIGMCSRLECDLYGLMNEKELTIHASRNFNANEIDELFELVRHNPRVKELVTHSFPLDQAEEAFRCAKQGLGLKVVLRPNG